MFNLLPCEPFFFIKKLMLSIHLFKVYNAISRRKWLTFVSCCFSRCRRKQHWRS